MPKNQAKQFVNNAPTYFGTQPNTAGPVYFGAIIFMFAILGFILIKHPLKWSALALILLSFFMAWGKNFSAFTDLLFENLPMYNKFRAPSMALVIAGLIFPLLAGLGLQKLLELKNSKNEIIKPLKIAGGITLGLILFFGIIGSFMNNFGSGIDQQISQGQQWLIDAFATQRSNMLLIDSIRSLVFCVLAFIAVWIFLKNKMKISYLYVTIGALIFFDLSGVGKRYLNTDNFESERKANIQFSQSVADQSILQDQAKPFRVFNTTVSSFNDAITSYHHHSVGGYSSAKLNRYQKLIDQHLSQGNMSVYSMLNTKYFIAPGQNGQPVAQHNPNFTGNAWFVSQINWLSNEQAELDALTDFNPKREVIINESFQDKISSLQYQSDSLGNQRYSTAGVIQLTDYSPKEITYSSSVPESQLAVFSEIYYDTDGGWQAYIDGEKSEHLRVNYLLRGIVVPPGPHEIKFVFEPKTYLKTEKTSMAFLGLLAHCCFGQFVYGLEEKIKLNQEIHELDCTS